MTHWLVVGLAVGGCGGVSGEKPQAARPASSVVVAMPSAAASAVARPSAQPSGMVKLHYKSVGFDALVSSDDRLLVRPVEVEPLGRGLLVDDLTQPAALPRLLGLGLSLDSASFVSPTRLLGFDSRAGVATVLALDAGSEARTSCLLAPVATADGKRLATIDAAGHLVLLDPLTLDVQWRLEAPVVPPKASELALAFGAGDLLVASYDSGALVVNPASKTVLFQSANAAALSGPLLSHNGRYLARGVCSGADLLWTLSIVELTSGATVFSRNEKSGLKPVFAFSRDEATAAISFAPSEVIVVSLPSGTERRINTGINYDTEAYGYLTDALALTEDGRFVCGHPATTIGKYTDCVNVIYADAKLGRPAPKLQTCIIDRDAAYILPRAAKVEREGRHVLSTSSATYTHTCNELLSPDHRLTGIVTARDDPKLPGSYLDAEMNLVDVASGSVIQRLALWAAPAGMAEVLSSSFSPRGNWLQIQFGEGFTTFDVQTGRAVPIPSGEGSGLAFSPSERLALLAGKDALLVITLSDGSTRRFPNDVGEYCLAGGRLSPPASCPAAPPPLAAAPSSSAPPPR